MLDQRMTRLEEGIQKAKLILDGYPTNQLFTSEEYMSYYNIVYDMCVRQSPNDCSQQLYERYKTAMEESISSRILPALTGKTGSLLIMELLRMWTNYKAMAKCLGGFFLYLERKWADRKKAEPLCAISVSCFHDLVCKDNLKLLLDAAVSLITQERNGQPVDWKLLHSISNFFVEIGGKGVTFYYDQFENALLADTACHYSQLASQWVLYYSFADYIMKVEECLIVEKARASQFLFPSSTEKLLEVVRTQLINGARSKVIEKQKVENHVSTAYQDLIGKCANLSIG